MSVVRLDRVHLARGGPPILEEVPTSATHAALLRRGRLVASGPVDAVLTSEAVSTAFGLRVRVGRDGPRFLARAG